MPEPDRPRFQFMILDLVVFVAAAAVGVAAETASVRANIQVAGWIGFWLVFAGVGFVGYLAVRFGRTREVRLIVLGLAVAFAGAADAMFFASYLNQGVASFAAVFALGPVALALVVGGLIHGLRAPRSAHLSVPEPPRPHPLDEDAPR